MSVLHEKVGSREASETQKALFIIFYPNAQGDHCANREAAYNESHLFEQGEASLISEAADLPGSSVIPVYIVKHNKGGCWATQLQIHLGLKKEGVKFSHTLYLAMVYFLFFLPSIVIFFNSKF